MLGRTQGEGILIDQLVEDCVSGMSERDQLPCSAKIKVRRFGEGVITSRGQSLR